MSEQKRYTAQEMREEAKQCKRLGYYVAEAMLRQAADSEEENAKLKARLEAVVKECEHFESMIARHGTLYQAEASNIHNAILRAARGEGGAE